ncbi:MAG: hypothetical protein LIO74_07760, partial [Ruminococcus sp.]|nr:hypothetical protein [Ruminococcus sp.]
TNTTGKKFKVEENGSEIDNHYFYLCDDYADNGYYLVMEYDEKTDEKYSMYVMSTNTEGVYQVTAIMWSNTVNIIELMTTTTEQTTTTTITTTVAAKNTLKTTKAITETTTTAETTKKLKRNIVWVRQIVLKIMNLPRFISKQPLSQRLLFLRFDFFEKTY